MVVEMRLVKVKYVLMHSSVGCHGMLPHYGLKGHDVSRYFMIGNSTALVCCCTSRLHCVDDNYVGLPRVTPRSVCCRVRCARAVVGVGRV
jgi:hypothetical protein